MKAEDERGVSLVARRSVLLGTSAGLLASPLLLTGCFGSFTAARALWEWNDDFGSKWVKWVVFLGLCILPVYSLFVLADVLVLNSVEFWTGSNPLARTADGRTIARHATDDPRTVRVEVSRDGQLECVAYFRRVSGEHLQLFSAEGQLQAEARSTVAGGVLLLDARGRQLAALDPAQVRAAEARVENGQSALLALRPDAALQERIAAAGGALRL